MEQRAKYFAAKLNHCLDDMEAPASTRERASILSKILDIPKHQAWSLIEGQVIPDEPLIERIASEFEVEQMWLTGKA